MCKRFAFLLVFVILLTGSVNAALRSYSPDCIRLSQNFLYAAKTGDGTQTYIDSIAHLDESQLQAQLGNDQKRLAFWLNLYNGFTQVILKKDPDQYQSRNAFFSANLIDVAGHRLSLDGIEHGILRHSKIKWSEGYLGKPFPPAFEKKMRVEKLDWRIHFALNCGAKSCPPIAFYEPEHIDQQLTTATRSYLKGECSYDEAANTVSVPALMGWFRGDFGGKKNIIIILKANKIIPQSSAPKLKFKPYDWNLYLNNYKSENNG